jgi:hypothetical protein
MRQEDLTEGHVIAVWLGDFSDLLDLDDYLGPEFERDYGFTINERSMPEISDPDGAEQNVRDLLNGFSGSRDWLDDAVHLCEQAGWSSAKAAVVFFHLRYRPELRTKADAPLQFVTNVPWYATPKG